MAAGKDAWGLVPVLDVQTNETEENAADLAINTIEVEYNGVKLRTSQSFRGKASLNAAETIPKQNSDIIAKMIQMVRNPGKQVQRRGK